jgi:hypothetical protein
MDLEPTLATEFARALVAKNEPLMLELLHPEIDFRALTPKRNWEASDPAGVISVILGHWFEESDEIKALEGLESDAFADLQRVGYRFSVSNPEGSFLVEQQAYLSERDGQIGWMRVLCSGFCPVSPPA